MTAKKTPEAVKALKTALNRRGCKLVVDVTGRTLVTGISGTCGSQLKLLRWADRNADVFSRAIRALWLDDDPRNRRVTGDLPAMTCPVRREAMRVKLLAIWTADDPTDAPE